MAKDALELLNKKKEINSMNIRFHILTLALLLMDSGTYADNGLEISHGPMLGAVSENSAAIWLRTTIPGDVMITLSNRKHLSEQHIRKLKTNVEADHAAIVRFQNLKPNSLYTYVVLAGDFHFEGTLTTLDSSLKDKPIRIVYGYGYRADENKMRPGTSVFTKMDSREANLVLFLGDFPYTHKGSKVDVRTGNKKLREVEGFTQLTSSTPTYGIYDDHDLVQMTAMVPINMPMKPSPHSKNTGPTHRMDSLVTKVFTVHL